MNRQEVEAIVLTALHENWYRMSRYSDPNEAGPALANVATEIARRLTPLEERVVVAAGVRRP